MAEALRFTDAEKTSFRAIYAPTATDDQWNLFINECQRRALVPGVHVVFQLRTAKEWDAELRESKFVKKVTLITTINALRLIADRSGKYEGHGPFEYYYGTEDGDLKNSKIPLGKIPHAVAVEGYRAGWRAPLFATARYAAYVQQQGKENEKRPTQMWATRGEEQLAKCCEALMLRTVAPEECAGLLINEELGNDGLVDRETTNEEVTKQETAVIPNSTVAPVVNQSKGTAEAAAPTLVFEGGNPPHTAPDSALVKKALDEAKPGATVTVGPAIVAAQVPNIGSAIVTLVAEAEQGRQRELHVMEESSRTQAPVASVAVAAVSTEGLPTKKENDDFLGRATVLVRDKLPKAGMKDNEASMGMKNYLLKQAGVTGLKQIPKVVYESLLKALEDAPTPEAAAAIVREKSK